jgi:phage terminase large subunit-like protein
MNHIEDFIGHMKHFEGSFNKKPFILLDFQRFVLASIFGWYYVDDPEKRVVEEVLLFIARKNAKTALSAAIILADMCIGKEAGYEGYLAAQTREQAKIAYKFIKGYAKSLDPKKKHFKIYRDHVIYPKTSGIVKVLSAEAGVSDGLNPCLALLDEQHASKDDDMYQVLKSGMGMRKNPLVIIISSGGYLMDGFPFYERV